MGVPPEGAVYHYSSATPGSCQSVEEVNEFVILSYADTETWTKMVKENKDVL